MSNTQRGFTLIELLVVIAIIGILSSVILASLSTARTKGRVAAAQTTLNHLRAALSICLNESSAINIPTDTVNGGGGATCAASTATYPALPAGWIYCDGTAGTQGAANCGNDVSAQTTGTSFSIVAESNGDGQKLTCTETNCAVVADSN